MDQTPHVPVELQRYVQQRVSEALGRYRRQAVVGFVLLLAGIGAALAVESEHNAAQRDQIIRQGKEAEQSIIRSGDAVAVSGCNRDYNTIDSLRDELERSLLRIDSLEADGTYSKHQADVSREATKDILKKYTLPDCRRADDVLTAKPGKTVLVPTARYPNDPQQRKDEQREADELDQKSDAP